jgi:hypothetical protein
MTTWYAILISGVSGAVVTLLGVVVGGVMTGRSQRRHWLRDKQIEACAALLRESTAIQIALRHLWKRQETTEWTAWNQALAMIWLIGTPAVRNEAKRMDRIFWLFRERIKRGQIYGESAWGEVRDEMELARRDLINAARREMVASKELVDDVPVGRPSLTEIDEMFGSSSA